MKRTELRIRRNYHVAKRIHDSISRRYGLDSSYPTARSTIPALIESARVLHADGRSGVSRDDVLQQHILVPGEASSPPTGRLTRRHQRDTLLLSTSRLNNSLTQRELRLRDEFLPSHIKNRDSWIEDEYLFAQIGNSHKIKCSCPFGEPDCGFGWSCDLCQDESAIHRSPAPLFQQPPVTQDSIEDEQVVSDDFYFNPHLFSSIRTFDYGDYFVPALFDTIPTPSIEEVCLNSTQAFSRLLDDDAEHVTSPFESPKLEDSSTFFSCVRINMLLLVFPVMLFVIASSSPVQRPGVPALCRFRPLLTLRVQHYVFDRGKCC